MNQSSSSTGHISASIVLVLIAIAVAMGLMAAGAYIDAQGGTTAWMMIEPTATVPLTYPCSPMADGSYLPARVQVQYEEQCKQQAN